MVLLSFLLVLAAAVTLVIGLLNGGLGLIYLSIACSVGAGIVLALAVVRSRPRAVPALGGPAPIPGGWGDDEPTAIQPASVRRRDAEPVDAPAYDEATFPIANYDALKVTDILPLLPELERDELEQVRAHETGGKNRSRILGRIDMLTSEAEWEGAGEDTWEPEPEPVSARATRGAATATLRRPAPAVVEDIDDDFGVDDDYDDLGDDDDFDDSFDEDDDDDYDDGDLFPIADYDELKVGEIMPLLPELDDDELEMVRERESNGQARGMILSRIDRLGGGPATPAKAPARKTAAKKSSRSTAKKTAATKRTTGAKKTAAKKSSRSTAKKTAATKRTTGAKKAAKKSTRSTAKKTAKRS